MFRVSQEVRVHEGDNSFNTAIPEVPVVLVVLPKLP